jgi:hypothetical protein
MAVKVAAVKSYQNSKATAFTSGGLRCVACIQIQHIRAYLILVPPEEKKL